MLVALVGVLITSCQKTNDQITPQNKPIVGKDKSGSTTTLTDEEIEARCKHISYILTEVIKTQGVTQEVFEGVKSGKYADESILMYDLLEPSQSPILSFQQNASNMKFAKAFQDAFNASAYMFAPNYTNVTYKELIQIIQQQRIMIYFPYSENWQGAEKPTLTYNTAEDMDENQGYEPSLIGNIINSFNAVTVNDDYADANPVWIVKKEEVDEPVEPSDLLPRDKDTTIVVTTTCPTFEKPYLVQINEVRVVEQLDRCFGKDSGGSEMYFVRGVLKNPNDKPEVEAIPLGKFTRKQIRKAKWVPIAHDFLTPWEVKNRHVVIGLYERDKKAKEEKKITGKASVTTTSGTTGTTNSSVSKDVEYEVVSREEIQYKNTWERCAFFKEIKQPSTVVNSNSGVEIGGERNGWRRYTASTRESEFTMFYKE